MVIKLSKMHLHERDVAANIAETIAERVKRVVEISAKDYPPDANLSASVEIRILPANDLLPEIKNAA